LAFAQIFFFLFVLVLFLFLFFSPSFLEKSEVLAEIGSTSLTKLRPGQLILHKMCRSLSLSQSQQLASLARLTHERHYDTMKFDERKEIYIAGGLTLGLALSASARDLHEVLHEEFVDVRYINALHPGEVLTALTYVKSLEENISGDMESLTSKCIIILAHRLLTSPYQC
jgi:hypothetical protein